MDTDAPKVTGLYRPHIALRLLGWFALYIGIAAAMDFCMPEYNAPWQDLILLPALGIENLATHMLEPSITDPTLRSLFVPFLLALYPLHLIFVLIIANRAFFRLMMSLMVTLVALSFFGGVFTSGWGDMLRNHGFHNVAPASPVTTPGDSGPHY